MFTQSQIKYLLDEEVEILLKYNSFYVTVNCSVSGHYIFKSYWDAPIVSMLSVKHEDHLQSLIHDKFSVALANNVLVTVDYLPRFMSKLVHVFIKYARDITFEVTISKTYSTDQEQGSLEVPTKITFCNSNEKITEGIKKKLVPLIEEGMKNTNK